MLSIALHLWQQMENVLNIPSYLYQTPVEYADSLSRKVRVTVIKTYNPFAPICERQPWHDGGWQPDFAFTTNWHGSFATPWATVYAKLHYYKQLQEDVNIDISYSENVLLYSRSSELVRRQTEKAAAVNTIVDHLSRLQWDTGNPTLYREILQTELYLTAFADVFSLNHERVHNYFEHCLLENSPVQETLFRIRRDQYMRGRMHRFAFQRLTRDIRRIYRTIVGSLFKQMDDQSGNDEFLVQAIPCYRQINSSKNWFSNVQSGYFGPN